MPERVERDALRDQHEGHVRKDVGLTSIAKSLKHVIAEGQRSLVVSLASGCADKPNEGVGNRFALLGICGESEAVDHSFARSLGALAIA